MLIQAMKRVVKATLIFLGLLGVTLIISFLLAIFIIPQAPNVLNPASPYWFLFNPNALERDPASALGSMMGELLPLVFLFVLSVEMPRRSNFFLAVIFSIVFILLFVGSFVAVCHEPGISGSVLFNVLFSQFC